MSKKTSPIRLDSRHPTPFPARLAFAVMTALALLLAPPATASPDLTDMEISDAVDDEFLLDPGVPSYAITVETHEGVVTLQGTVSNLLAKERAARVAGTIKGVTSVVNEIQVKPPVNRSDEKIRRDVLVALAEDPAADSYEIDVTVTDGTVTLTGDVQSWQERRLAETIASGVRGVTAVVNSIDIEFGVDRADREIQAEIEETLRWDILVDEGLIDVAVDDGHVTLTGTVGSVAERNRARADAWSQGVISVDTDNLTIQDWARNPEVRNREYVPRTDDQIREAVENALLYDPRVLAVNVDTHVQDGVVTLRGEVSSLKAKRSASDDARNTVGVIRVKNRLKVDPLWGLDDDAIEARLRQALTRDPFVDRFEISTSVIGGVAYLYGTVDSYFEKAEADDVASRVDGVLAVENNLTVDNERRPYTHSPYVDDWYVYDYDWYGYQPATTLKSDTVIAEDIESQLWWSPFVDADDVTVVVEDGIATLTGTVDSWSEYNAARENAYEGGAVWVDNELTVVR